MITPHIDRQEAVDSWPCIYATGYAQGEDAYHNGFPWGYADKISDRFDKSVRLRWLAHFFGLYEGYYQTESEHEARQLQPMEA